MIHIELESDEVAAHLLSVVAEEFKNRIVNAYPDEAYCFLKASDAIAKAILRKVDGGRSNF